MSIMKLFEQVYDAESIVDLPRDMHEVLDEDLNPVILDIPRDEDGFWMGKFKVNIEWSE